MDKLQGNRPLRLICRLYLKLCIIVMIHHDFKFDPVCNAVKHHQYVVISTLVFSRGHFKIGLKQKKKWNQYLIQNHRGKKCSVIHCKWMKIITNQQNAKGLISVSICKVVLRHLITNVAEHVTKIYPLSVMKSTEWFTFCEQEFS